MNVREFLNNNSAVVTIGAVVVLVFALVAIIMQRRDSGGPAGPVDAYFYDMTTGKVFIRDGTEIPPIEAPSGPYQGQPGGVSIRIFACGKCDNYDGMTVEQIRAQGAFPLWLEMYSPEIKQQMMSGEYFGPMAMMGGGQLIKPIDRENWVTSNTPEATLVQQGVSGLCPEGRPTPCWPGR